MGDNIEKMRSARFSRDMEVSELFSSPELAIGLFSEKMQIVYGNKALLKLFDASDIDDLKSIPLKLFFADNNLTIKLLREINKHQRLKEKAITYYTLRKQIRTLVTSGKFINYKGKRYFLVWINPDKKIQNRESKLLFQNQKLMRLVSPGKPSHKQLQPPIKSLFELSHEAIIIFDRLSIIDCNKSFLQEFCYNSKSEIAGKDIYTLFPEKQQNGQVSLDLINELFVRLESVEETISFKWDHQKKDASRFPAQVSIIPVLNEKDPFYYMLIRNLEVGNDLPYTKPVTDKILFLKEQHDVFFRHASEMLCIIDSDGKFVQVNSMWESILGWDANELANTLWIDLIHPQDIDNIFNSPSLQSKHPKPKFDARIKLKGGGYKWIEWSANVLKNSQMMYAVVRNMSDKERYEKDRVKSRKELEELNAHKDRLLAIISHDLKSPLSSISQLSEIILEQYDYLSKDEQINCLRLMQENAKSTLNLAQDLLIWAKGQMGNLDIRTEKILLHKVVDDSIKGLELRIKNKQIKIANNISGKIYCWADLNSIKTVIRNIISNAIKFTSKGGLVRIEAEVQNEKCVVSIKDTGIGMSQELMNKLFDISNIVSTSGTENEKGNGLGLLLCKGLIEKNDGQLWVHSKVNAGSTFYFSLPVA